MKSIAIVGGGASGVFCALQVLDSIPNAKITIFEKNGILKTLLPTGGGRCNLSHYIDNARDLVEFYPRGGRELISIFSKFGVLDTIEKFKEFGIETYTDEKERIYPTSNSSKEVREKMFQHLKKYKNLKIVYKEVKSIKELDNFDIKVIAGGSKGVYGLISDTMHSLTELRSALCGYITDRTFKAGVSIDIKGEPLLFTHQGISGPYIFKLSSIWAYKDFPFDLNIEIIDKDNLKSALNKNPKQEFGTILGKFLPKSLVSEILEENLRHTKCANVSKKMIDDICTMNFKVLDVDKKGETVKAGGIPLKELTPNLESKFHENLFFTGEILNVDGLCGGFNLQFAWSSGTVVANEIIKKITN